MIPPFHLIDAQGNFTQDPEQVAGRQIANLRVWNDGRQEKKVGNSWQQITLPRPTPQEDP